MFSHTTHHTQKRDLLWGCYTRVSTTRNPLWTKTTRVKTQIDIPFIIGISFLVHTKLFFIKPFWKSCLYTFGTGFCIGGFQGMLDHCCNNRTRTVHNFLFFKHIVCNKDIGFLDSFWRAIFLHKKYIITEYQFNIVTALPCFGVFLFYHTFCSFFILIRKIII